MEKIFQSRLVWGQSLDGQNEWWDGVLGCYRGWCGGADWLLLAHKIEPVVTACWNEDPDRSWGRHGLAVQATETPELTAEETSPPVLARMCTCSLESLCTSTRQGKFDFQCTSWSLKLMSQLKFSHHLSSGYWWDALCQPHGTCNELSCSLNSLR